mmetsp:Transcript_17861/g.46743  ORF Transcript_17861/g.46743 Transcript_17861/m.46743 type:complete len:81 (-) Transcript_17861:434-676(-)
MMNNILAVRQEPAGSITNGYHVQTQLEIRADYNKPLLLGSTSTESVCPNRNLCGVQVSVASQQRGRGGKGAPGSMCRSGC